MKLSKYFKIVGTIEIFLSVLATIFGILKCMTNILALLAILIAAFFAPAFGMALCALGDLLEKNNSNSEQNNHTETITNKDNIINNSNTDSILDKEKNDEEQFVKTHDPEYYEQLKKDYNNDKTLFYEYIHERYMYLKEIIE